MSFFCPETGSRTQDHVPFIDPTVVTINNTPVSRREFASRMQWLKGNCFDHFIKQPGTAGLDGKFWNRPVNGISPINWIKKESLQQLVKEKVTLHLMQQYKVLEGFNYSNFLQAYNSENKKRSITLINGGVMYGIQAFDELNFYAYIFSNARLQTQKQILRITPPDEVIIKAYYKTAREKEFKIPGTITVTRITFNTGKEADPGTIQLKLRVKKGNFKGIRDLINDLEHQAALSCMDIIFDPAFAKTDEMMWGNVMDQAYKLNKTAVISPLFTDEDGNDCFLLYKKTMLNGYLPFNDVKENIRMKWAEKQLEEMVRQGISKAIVRIEPGEWDMLDNINL